jgi:oligopeptide/dipeptide ABC transporter ATP-binding protein
MNMLNIKDKILEIKDLRVSFRTNNGTVKAVRGISVGLNRGETLAIVGESGSGKSVTAKAIMGILAGNSIIDNGEIIYDGRDLLKLTEEEFNNYRGSRLAMIFQDPLSSLNPIMKIGRQMTEAMVLNGRAKQRDSRRSFNQRLRSLCAFMENGKDTAEKIRLFKKIASHGADLYRAYSVSLDRAGETASDISDILIDIINGKPKKVAGEISSVIIEAEQARHEYVIDNSSNLSPLLNELKNELELYKKTGAKERITTILTKIKGIVEEAAARAAPDFFALAYFRMNNRDNSNGNFTAYFNDNYYNGFASLIEKAMRKSYAVSIEAKKRAVEILKECKPAYEGSLDKRVCLEKAKIMATAVSHAIDRCALEKDSWAYIFGTSMKSYINAYFKGITNNIREQRRFDKSTAEYNKRLSQGRPVPTPVPAVICDLEQLQRNMNTAIERLIDNFSADIASNKGDEMAAESRRMISLMFEDAVGRLNKVTKRSASNKAVRVMKDVGIPEPRKRFRQYPFELSGGMRQRIVIAIALSSNPEILICDEPTTALDVTIQSQILELINGMKAKYNLSVIFITHNLGVVANMADKVAVMYAGKIVEYGLTEEIFHHPAHPYTWALLASMPDLDTKEKLDAIPGTPPNMIYPPAGDAFAERSKYAMKIDFVMQPPEFKISDTHWAATWLLHPKAPRVEPPKIVTERIERMKRYKS